MDCVVKLTDVQYKKSVVSVRKRSGGGEDDKRTDSELVSEWLFGQLDGIVKYDEKSAIQPKGL